MKEKLEIRKETGWTCYYCYNDTICFCLNVPDEYWELRICEDCINKAGFIIDKK